MKYADLASCVIERDAQGEPERLYLGVGPPSVTAMYEALRDAANWLEHAAQFGDHRTGMREAARRTRMRADFLRDLIKGRDKP